jgi:hypothetical protein
VLAALHPLEISFIVLLLAMLGLAGLIGLVVVVRIVEPAGFKALFARLTGKTPPGFRSIR